MTARRGPVQVIRRQVDRHATVLATVVAAVMLASWAAAVVGVFALHLAVTDLILWPAVASFVVSGWVLAVRRPRNSVGWLLLMTAGGLSFLPWSVLSAWMMRDGVTGARWTGGLSNGAFVLDVGGLALLLPLVFPDGKLPSRARWWRVVLLADLLYMLFAGANLFTPGRLDLPGGTKADNPFGWPHHRTLLGVFISLCVPCLLTGFVGSFTALATRWRSADPARRAQMKWVILALILAPIPFILHDWWLGGSNVLMTVVLPLVPVAIAVSVLRFHLYDIDRIVSRAVSYLVVTVLLVGVYLGCVALLTSMLPFGSSIGVAGSTLAAAALFHPVRHQVQQRIDRRFNRERYDAGRTVDAFALRLRDEVDPDVVRSDLLAVAAGAMEPTTLSLWVVP